MQVQLRAFRRLTAAHLALVCAACGGLPHGPYEPVPLRGAARQLMRDMMAASPSPAEAGEAATADGARVPYDRYCLVGSEFAGDRMRTYFAFVDDLGRLGGDVAALERDRDGRATKILVVVDGQRVVVTYMRW